MLEIYGLCAGCDMMDIFDLHGFFGRIMSLRKLRVRDVEFTNK